MDLLDLAKFQLGTRSAILRIAAARYSWLVGLLLVFSVALARRYDRADLMAQPVMLLVPLILSLANATVLFALLWCLHIRRAEDRPGIAEAYRVVVTLFWMTAPLAWLYAIPVERFLSVYQATSANLWLLLVVALWRVVLFARAIDVILRISMSAAVFVTLLFGDVVAIALLYFSPKPIVAIMGGMLHTAADLLILEVTFWVAILGLGSLIFWLIGTIVTVLSSKPKWQVDTLGSPPSRGVWLLTLCALLIWLPILPTTQAEQRSATKVEQHLSSQEIDQAVALMSRLSRDEFPPHFNPRPRFWPGETEPSAWLVLESTLRQEAPSWVVDLYLDKAKREIGSSTLVFEDPAVVAAVTHCLTLDTRIPDLVAEDLAAISRQINQPDLSAESKASLEAFLRVWRSLGRSVEP